MLSRDLPSELDDTGNERENFRILNTFRNTNILFVRGGDNDKAEFVSLLQNDLRTSGMRFESINISSSLNETLKAVLSNNRENVLVPTSGDSNTLRRLMDEVKELKESDGSYAVRLFGYPEWQTYSSLKDEYHQLGTYLYTPFFVNQSEQGVERFNDLFKRWYGREPMDTYPGYAMWGYDTALYFLSALQRHGVGFEQHLNQMQVNPVQFAFHFERMNNWGGFINTGLYLVYYDPNGNIIKMDRSR